MTYLECRTAHSSPTASLRRAFSGQSGSCRGLIVFTRSNRDSYRRYASASVISGHEWPGHWPLIDSKIFERLDLLDSLLPQGFGAYCFIVLDALARLFIHRNGIGILPVCMTGNSTRQKVFPMRIIPKLPDELCEKMTKLGLFSRDWFSAF